MYVVINIFYQIKKNDNCILYGVKYVFGYMIYLLYQKIDSQIYEYKKCNYETETNTLSFRLIRKKIYIFMYSFALHMLSFWSHLR